MKIVFSQCLGSQWKLQAKPKNLNRNFISKGRALCLGTCLKGSYHPVNIFIMHFLKLLTLHVMKVSGMQRQNQTLEETGGRTKYYTQNTHSRLDLMYFSIRSAHRIWLRSFFLFFSFTIECRHYSTRGEVISVSRSSLCLCRDWQCQLMSKWHVSRVALISNNFTF